MTVVPVGQAAGGLRQQTASVDEALAKVLAHAAAHASCMVQPSASKMQYTALSS